MRVFGLDISKSVTGWACTDGDDWWSGALRCPIKKPFHLARGKLDANYAADVADWLDRELWQLVAVHKPDRVGIEQPMPGNSMRQRTVIDTSSNWAGQAVRKEAVGGTAFDVTHFLHGTVWTALRVFRRHDIPIFYVASQTWRSTVGIGHPPKGLQGDKRRQWYKQRAKDICEHRGINVRGADEAEACCIAIHMYDQIEPGFALGRRGLFRNAS